eukprot:742953-Rhodomonas_salina.1
MICYAIAHCNMKPKPKCLDILEGIVSTPDIDEEMLDDNWDRTWVMEPWKQPAIKVWVKMLTCFEELNETTTTNVITKLGRTMGQAVGKDALTVVRTIMMNIYQIFGQLSQHFRTVEELLDYMVASTGAGAVLLKSGIDNGHGRAMGKADEYLIKELYENHLLTKSSMERALSIAKKHMPRIESGATKGMQAAIPSTTEDEQPSSEKPKADLSPGEVCKLWTLLSQMEKTSCDSGSQSTTGTKRPRPDSGHYSNVKG